MCGIVAYIVLDVNVDRGFEEGCRLTKWGVVVLL